MCTTNTGSISFIHLPCIMIELLNLPDYLLHNFTFRITVGFLPVSSFKSSHNLKHRHSIPTSWQLLNELAIISYDTLSLNLYNVSRSYIWVSVTASESSRNDFSAIHHLLVDLACYITDYMIVKHHLWLEMQEMSQGNAP